MFDQKTNLGLTLSETEDRGKGIEPEEKGANRPTDEVTGFEPAGKWTEM